MGVRVTLPYTLPYTFPTPGFTFSGAGVGRRSRLAGASGGYGWAATAAGLSSKHGTGEGAFRFTFIEAIGDNGEYLPEVPRWRVIVQAARGTREIIIPDLVVEKLAFQRVLSGPCDIQFDIDPQEPTVDGVYFKPWAQLIHIERVMQGKRRIWCSAIVQPSEIDTDTGVLHLKAKGFAFYPKGIPWLQDINWIFNDAYDPVVKIWAHLQEDFNNGHIGVDVYPPKSGVIMLPGYAFDGDLLNLNFYATFVRETDKLDCGDYIDALAKDIPFDYLERQQWNADGTDIIKRIQLGQPRLGLIQENLAFIQNENVLTMKPHVETQTDWVSDVGVSGFFPGFEYSFELANADPDRLRRYLDEEDGFIDSNERAAAWAHRRLARRQTPPYWEEITIDPDHSNAPLGTFDVGDTITVSGFMPWVNAWISQAHKIVAIGIDDEEGECRLTLKAEGAFNYDPIYYPNGLSNIISNPTFDFNLSSWDTDGGAFTHDATQGSTTLGSALVHCDGEHHDLQTQIYGVSPFQIFPLSVSVKAVGAVPTIGTPTIHLVAVFFDDDLNFTEQYAVATASPRGTLPWTRLSGKVIAIPPSTHCMFRLHVDAGLAAGRVWVDDAEMVI